MNYKHVINEKYKIQAQILMLFFLLLNIAFIPKTICYICQRHRKNQIHFIIFWLETRKTSELSLTHDFFRLEDITISEKK